MRQPQPLPRLPSGSIRALALELAFLFARAPAGARDLPSFQLTIKAGRFHPEVIEAPADIKLRRPVRNEGPGPEEFESIEWRKEEVLAPAASRFLIFQPLTPGRYKFVGEFHPETAQRRIVAQ